MRINFLSYLDPFVHSGGGEVITKRIIETGRARGHEIFVSAKNPQIENWKEDSSFNIFWDVFNCPEENTPYSLAWIKKLAQDKPYIYGQNGYEDLCLLGTLPCEGESNGKNCLVSINHKIFGAGGIHRPHPHKCVAEERSSLWKESKLNVFLTEHHKEKYEKILGILPNTYVMTPPCPSLEAFKNLNLTRDIPYLSYGGHLEYKGFFNIMEKLPNAQVAFIGGGDTGLIQKYKYGIYLGKIPFEKMPEVLNRTQTFVHLPRWAEPFGLTTLQAYLCGCELLVNEYADVIKNRSEETIRNESKSSFECSEFWEKIENTFSEKITVQTTLQESTKPQPNNLRIETYTPPLLSVIIPSYNYAKYLTESVESVIGQPYPFVEIIVIDDESPDNTKEVFDSLKTKYPKTSLQYFRKKNGGPSDSRNYGIQRSKGSWILPLDADDIFASTYITKAISQIKQFPDTNIVTCDLQEFGDRSGHWSPDDYEPGKLFSHNCFIYSSLYSRELYDAVGGYYTGLPFGVEDWCFWLACSIQEIKCRRIRERLLLYRTHGSGLYSEIQKHWSAAHAFGKTLFPHIYEPKFIITEHEFIRQLPVEYIEKIQKTIDRFPDLNMPHFWQGLVYEGQAEFFRARECYERAVSGKGQNNWQALTRLHIVNQFIAKQFEMNGHLQESKKLNIESEKILEDVKAILKDSNLNPVSDWPLPLNV